MPNSTGSSLETRIVGAVADLWESTLRLRSFVHSFVWFQTILIPKEYDLVISSPVKFGIPQLTQEDFSIQANKLASDAEKVRPFVGESIWAYFSVYRTFGLRQALKVIDGLSKGHLHEWDKDLTGNPDRYGLEVIGSLFGEDELRVIHQDKRFTATLDILSAIELRILTDMNGLLFERKYQSLPLEKQYQIHNLITVGGDMSIGGDFAGRDKEVAD